MVSHDAMHIVATRAAPVNITAILPVLRRAELMTDCSAKAMGSLIGGNPLRMLAASYSCSRTMFVTREHSGHSAQCCMTGESAAMSLSDAVDRAERVSAQVIGRALHSSDALQEIWRGLPRAP